MLFPLIGLLTSCFKEDERVIPLPPGDVSEVVIEMLPDYSLQSYFNLSEGAVVSSNIKDDWDIALSCVVDDFTLVLNTARFIRIAHTGSDLFEVAYSSDGFEYSFDSSDGNPLENAIGRWWNSTPDGPVSLNEVLLVDRGLNEEGLPAGYIKIQPIIDPASGEVSIRIAELDGSEERTFEFTRQEGLELVVMSFDTGQLTTQPIPAAADWDLLFTQYTTMLFTDTGEEYPYLVTGVLINDTLVTAVMDSVMPFDQIDREAAEKMVLSTRRDVIGYEWKRLKGDVTSGDVTYEAIPEMVYIIKNIDGFYFKLRFTDFYNEQGQKGYPTFEYQKL
ncbi:MAG: HmuY family protein [Bacteroidales bacterium]|nr:HmuY family protein [Bacteroidales bacterium]